MLKKCLWDLIIILSNLLMQRYSLFILYLIYIWPYHLCSQENLIFLIIQIITISSNHYQKCMHYLLF